MRWLTFILFAACMVTLQSAVAPRLEIWGARPDWLLIVVVFLGLRARPFDAIAGSWTLGALADLMTIERLGLMAFSYGLAAMLVVSIREALFRGRGLTHFAVALVVCLLVQTTWCLYRRVLYDPAQSVPTDFASLVVLGSVYTAVWAPLMNKVLSPMSRVLGIPRPRYTYAGLSRPGECHV